MIKDSGSRTEFESGAVRDIQEGKGRCDLLPLDVVASLAMGFENRELFRNIAAFTESGDTAFLIEALCSFSRLINWDFSTMMLEVSIHFEEGAKKYSENNWRLGINAKNYINSGVRHLLKYMRGDNDERHDRAFIWNILCCMWTCINKPELNDYKTD